MFKVRLREKKILLGKLWWGDYKLIEKRSFKVIRIKRFFLEVFIIVIFVLGIDIFGLVFYLFVYISYMFLLIFVFCRCLLIRTAVDRDILVFLVIGSVICLVFRGSVTYSVLKVLKLILL